MDVTKKWIPARKTAGESNTTKVTSTNSYAKLTINGEVLYEVDLINMVGIVDLMEARTATPRPWL